MSERYTTVDCDGDWFGSFDTPEKAFAAIDDLSPAYAPYTVAKLVPVPRPVPPRPVGTGSILGATVKNGHLMDGKEVCSISCIVGILEAADLIRATEQWEREHGGAQA